MENNKGINISGVGGDVIGVGVYGSGNIIGENIHLGGSNYVFAQRIKAPEELRSYYSVDDPSRIINIRDLEVKEIRNWVENWHSTSGKAKKPILLITGDPGIGKSWLAYRLVSELMNEGYNVSVISKPPLFSGSRATSYNDDDSDNPKVRKKSVFAIDDRGTSVGERSTLIGLDEIYEIVKSILPSGLPQSLQGPIILSIREENWSYIVNGTKNNKEKLDELVLEKEVVEKVVLDNLEYEQSEKMVKSFYTEVDGNTPPYPNLVVNEEVKRKIIEKSKGIPVVVKLFFDHKASKTTDDNNSKNVVLTESDAEEIISDAKDYALKELFNYYLNEMNNRQTDKVSNVLAFLYFIAKQGFISIGHLIRIREQKMKNQDYLLFEYVWQHLDLLNYKRPLPLFNIVNDYGILVPFHDSVSEAIVSLVEDPVGLEGRTSKDQNEIIDKIRLIEGIDIDNDVSIKKKSENDFITPYKDSIINSMDYFLEKRLYREIERRGTISDESAYNFMSIFIEFLTPRKDFEFGDEIKDKFIEKFKVVLEKGKIDYGEMEIGIHKQLYSIFWQLEWFELPIKGFKEYYLDLLSSKSKDVRARIWNNTTYLIRDGVITVEELRPLKEKLFELLKSKDYWIRSIAGANIWYLIENKVITVEDRKIFTHLLDNSDEGIRSVAWENVYDLIENKVITVEELRPLKEKLFELLKSTDERIRENVWRNMWYLIENKVITVEDRKIFTHLLDNSDEGIRSIAWKNISSLIRDGVITVEELRPLKEKLFELLKSKDYWIRSIAGANIYDLIENKVITYEIVFEVLDKIININSDNAMLWYFKGVVLAELKRYEEAIVCYDEALDINPNNADTWYNKGFSLGNLSKYEEAIKAYDKAIQINPNDPLVWYNKGNALYALGKYEEAIQCYDEALDISPNNADTWYNKGYALNSLGKYNEAIQAFDRAIEIDPNDPLVWYNKGNALGNLGRYDEAIQAFDRAIEIDPNIAIAWYNKGLALGKLERYNEAIQCYDKAIQIHPNYTDAWYVKGVILHNLKKYDGAIACYDKVLEINPDSLDIKAALAEALMISKDYSKSERLAKEVIDRTDDKILVYIMHLLIVCSLYMRGSTAEGRKETLDLLNNFEFIPTDSEYDWSFDDLKEMINYDSRLSKNEKEILYLLISLLETKAADYRLKYVNEIRNLIGK